MFIDCGRIDVKEHAVSMLCEVSHSNPNMITFDVYDMLRSYKMTTSDMSLSHAIEVTLQEIIQHCVHLHTQIDEYEKSMLPTRYNNNDNKEYDYSETKSDCKFDGTISELYSCEDMMGGDSDLIDGESEHSLISEFIATMEFQSYFNTDDHYTTDATEIKSQQISHNGVHLHPQIDEYAKSMLPACYNNNDNKEYDFSETKSDCKLDATTTELYPCKNALEYAEHSENVMYVESDLLNNGSDKSLLSEFLAMEFESYFNNVDKTSDN
jgi:hypothetical protein